jgi:hypothetical protein
MISTLINTNSKGASFSITFLIVLLCYLCLVLVSWWLNLLKAAAAAAFTRGVEKALIPLWKTAVFPSFHALLILNVCDISHSFANIKKIIGSNGCLVWNHGNIKIYKDSVLNK